MEIAHMWNASPFLLIFGIFGAVMLSIFATITSFGQAGEPLNVSLALEGGTIYLSPKEEPIRDGVVLIQGGKIAAVGSRGTVPIHDGVPTLDCSGLTITAGFWNSHVHFSERKWTNVGAIPAPELGQQLKDMLTRYGFTSVFDIGSMWENTRRLRDRIESGEVPGPRIRSTGEALVPPGALPSETVIKMMGWMNVPAPEIENAAQAAAASRELLDAGVDGIKLFPSSPRNTSLPEIAIRAAVAEAHRSGKPAFAHPDSSADILAAVQGGIDVIAHTTPHSGPWDETVLSAMKDAEVALTPTLTIWKYYARHDRLSAQEQIVDTEISQLKAWVDSGGIVLFGNDLGAVDYDPSEEYALMARAGMSFRQILASLTTAPAERFGESDQLGRVAVGLQADLVVLEDDPSENIAAFTVVRYTLRDGRVIYQAAE